MQTVTRSPALTMPVVVYAVQVKVQEHHYEVSGLGDGRLHQVQGDVCRCNAGPECPAVEAVENHLRAGGAAAPDCPPDYFDFRPSYCPVCQAPTEVDCRPLLSAARHGTPWRCRAHGRDHYLLVTLLPRLKAVYSPEAWVVPPSDDQPGIRRADLAGGEWGYRPECNQPVEIPPGSLALFALEPGVFQLE